MCLRDRRTASSRTLWAWASSCCARILRFCPEDIKSHTEAVSDQIRSKVNMTFALPSLNGSCYWTYRRVAFAPLTQQSPENPYHVLFSHSTWLKQSYSSNTQLFKLQTGQCVSPHVRWRKRVEVEDKKGPLLIQLGPLQPSTLKVLQKMWKMWTHSLGQTTRTFNCFITTSYHLNAHRLSGYNNKSFLNINTNKKSIVQSIGGKSTCLM